MLYATIPFNPYNDNSPNFLSAGYFLTLVFILCTIAAQAQDETWSWISTAKGPRNDRAEGICTDQNGNVYTTGYFCESLNFGNINLIDNGNCDIFLAKYDDLGNVLWANAYGGTSLDFTLDICSDGSGNILLTGAFRSNNISFGSYSLSNPNSGNGADALFVVKLNPDGEVVWASTVSSDSNCRGNSVDTDSDGNVIVTGTFTGTSLTAGTVILDNSYVFFDDIFIIKYDTSGNVLWAKSYGGNSYDSGSSLAIDQNGNINLTGSFESNTMGLGNTTLNNTGGQDYFIAQFNPSGDINWVNHATGDGYDNGNDITTDDAGNVFVAGSYAGTSIIFDADTLFGNDYINVFIVKYDSGGKLQWTLASSGDSNDGAYAVSTDNQGNLLVTGEFQSETLTFGDYSLTNTQLDYSDIFVVIFNGQGDVTRSIAAGGSEDEYGAGITTFGDNHIYLIGSFYSSEINFGSTSIMNTTTDYYDYFIAKINSTATRVNDFAWQKDYSIFPNPSTDFVNLNFTLAKDANVNIKIYDMTGSLVKSIQFGRMHKAKYNPKIDIGDLNNGLYLMSIQTESSIVTEKFQVFK